ncbi:MAG: hypothetical protein E4H20_06730, partial [Spirochaetales bacterium]
MVRKKLPSRRMNRLTLGALAALSILTLSTCKGPLFGLGGAVDLEAPRSISVSPGTGSFRSGIITFSGVASDAYGLASAELRILDKLTGAELAKLSATVSNNTWTTGNVDTAQFPDGLYNIAVTLKDARGNTTEDRVLIGFDNRAPTVLIEEPLDLSAEYNGIIHISGQAYDSLSAVTNVNVALFRIGETTPLFSADSATLPKWDVIFDASNPAYAPLNSEDLVLVATATDEGGNTNAYQYEYRPLVADENSGNPITASQLDQLDAKPNDTDTIVGLDFDKGTLVSYRMDTADGTASTPTLLKVNVNSDLPTFTFVTPGETCTTELLAERYAGGTKANGTVRDDDLNVTDMTVQYRYVLSPGDITSASWSSATVEGNPGYEQRWSFSLPGANGVYKIQLQAQDTGSANGISGERYVIIDDGRPLVNIDTNDPVAWNLYYGKDQTILVSGSANRDGAGNSIDQVMIQVGSGAWVDITASSSDIGTNTATWSSYPLSLTGLTGGQTQVRIKAMDNFGVWGQSEVLIIMDVDAPIVTITDPGSNLNGTVTLRGTAEDGAGDAFITVLQKVEAKIDSGVYAPITGTYAWSWAVNTQNFLDGGHTVWIKAYDTAGNITETSRALTVLQSMDKPTVAVNNLVAGNVVGGTFIISGTASDDDGMASATSAVQMKIEIEATPGVWTTQQDWTDVTNKVGSSTSLSWTQPLPSLSSGSYRISVRARDLNSAIGDFGSVTLPQVNYWNETATIAFSVDNDVPVVNQTGFSPTTGSYVNDDFTLTGTITEDKSLASVSVFINGVEQGAGSAIIGGTVPNFTFSFDVDKTWLTGVGGSNSIRVDATDNSSPAKTGSGTVQIIYDNTAPQAVYLTPDDGSTVNGTLSVSGTASDDNQVASLYYAVAKAADPVPAFDGGYTLLVNQKYAFNFTVDTTFLTDDTAYKIYLVAKDGAGNDMATAPATPQVLNVAVDQDSDRPIIKLSNIDPDGLPELSTLKMSNTVFGSVSDDDGTITAFAISEDGTIWNPVPLSGGTFSYNSSAGDGTKTLYFKVTDKIGKVFATNSVASADKPRVENGAIGVYIESTVSYKVDTNFPDVFSTVSVDRSAPLDMADLVDLTTNLPFGGAGTGQFRIRVLATDASGISSVTVAVPGAAGSPFTALANGTEIQGATTFTRYDTDILTPIDVTSGIDDGGLAVTIEVTDGSELKSTVIRSILVDNSAPSYSVTTPAHNEVINGDITVKGTALDQTAGLKSVEYKLGYNYASESWAPVGGSIYSWEIDLTGANKSDLFAGKAISSVDVGTNTLTSAGHGFAIDTQVYFSATSLPGGILSNATYYVVYQTANDFRVSTTLGGAAVDVTTGGTEVFVSAESKDPDNDQIWDFPIFIRAVDNAGNEKITTPGDYMVRLDPGGDRPRVTISYPDEPNKTLGGTIRVYGLATDDDAVDSVYMMVDVNNDSLFNAADIDTELVDWYNGGLGQQVNGSANWYRTINSAGEFNPEVGTRTISIKLRARDIYGTYGAWTPAQPIIIDKNVPQFGSQSAIAIDPDATAGNGNELAYSVGMYVNGTTVYLRGSVTDDGGITDIQVSGAITGSLTGNPTWFSAGYAGTGYDMAIPISLPAGTSGSRQFTLTAYDNSATPRESVYEVRFNYDNEAPIAALNVVASPPEVVQSNGWYKIKGTAEDIGSDVDR